MKVAKMKMLCQMSGVTRLDRVKNEYIIGYLGVQSIARKTKRNKLRQFGHVERRNYEDIVKKMGVIRNIRKIRKSRRTGVQEQKKKRMEVLKGDTRTCGVDKNTVRNRER